ncbi:MAG: agmatine deiminase family protein, partial [Gammaproteobacteria bacterium]|nr:agmatine deiminase family protein [Gammaproteobacteria bacterium]
MPTHHLQHRLPAEWEPQSAILLCWPHENSDWKDNLAPAEAVYLKIAKHICLHEELIIVCYNQLHQIHIKKILEQNDVALQSVHFGIAPSNDTWIRDYGPISVTSSTTTGDGARLLNFEFDAWGGKYPSDKDNLVTNTLYESGIFEDTSITNIDDLVLEGGGIESDGMGTLLTTDSCLFGGSRNKNLGRMHIETQLTELFGLQRILSLKHGYVAGDDTDGHIDTLARFCNEHTIAYTACNDEQDEHYQALKAMENELKEFTTLDGQPYKLLALPIPEPIYNKQGDRLPATYANFLIINDAVLVPVYGDTKTDQMALEVLSGCFPDREII